ncbi:PREDICTED: histone chaperone RTT106-like isoform X2 [Cyphomyrmex costatus]|uniref:histone chaperone RTT106-like isoform X2 n=1 Tax=Cyphomyrmex costatus TaxID=456900 RepID=UPI00085221F7|nr:PREDICTED: histone chaperone RTT106-like isoform X2 [Cyphomyrmex costatus]
MESSSNKAIDETSQEDCIWIELRLLQSIMIQSRLGQTILKLIDYFLWIVEKCMEWSLPRQNIKDEKDSKKMELVRPLPWLLFLPSLIILRIIRVIVNIGASILSYPKITSSEMVKLVQKYRRYLHDTMKKKKKEKKEKYNELKVTTTSEEKSENKSEEKSVTESMDSATSKDSSESEDEKQDKEEREKKEWKESVNDKIDRLALENSEDDEDFEPDECSSSGTNSIDDDDENSDGNVSLNEINDIIEDAVTFKKNKNIEQFLHAEQTSTLACKQEPIESACEKKTSAKESRDKVEEHLAPSQRIDSSECCTPDRSSQEDPTFYSPISLDNDSPKKLLMSTVKQYVSRKILDTKEFINGEVRFISASTISESKSSRQTDNAVTEKYSTNVSKGRKGKRTSRSNRKKK